MYGWNEAPTKAESTMTVNDEPVYDIGRYQVTIHKNGTVTYRTKYGHTTDPRATLPNMEISDGEIRIPATDLVGLILSRLDPVDLARALWTDAEVKEAFMECLVHRYNEQGIDDADRRKFLAEVKEAVHSKALDGLASTMASLEYDVSKRSFFYHEVNRINDWLREQGHDVRLKHDDNDPDFKIGGRHWNEARQHWRDEVVKRFEGPTT